VAPANGTLADLLATMKRAVAAFERSDVHVMLAGGLASWARGGPPTDHDVDFYVRESDAEWALDALVDAGMHPERPPEGWLLKAWDNDVLVDLIYRPAGQVVDDEMFARGELIEVMAQPMLVASVDDILVSKLLALSEQEPDFSSPLAVARALREQVDWQAVRTRTSGSPFGHAFFALVEKLGIVDEPVTREQPRW
jgi:hypothetical protein